MKFIVDALAHQMRALIVYLGTTRTLGGTDVCAAGRVADAAGGRGVWRSGGFASRWLAWGPRVASPRLG